MDPNNNNNGLDFENPGYYTDEQLEVPGLIKAMTDYTMRQSFAPNKVIATAGALACLSHLTGRTFRDSHGARTNLYMVLLAETGAGKEAPRQANRKIIAESGMSASVIDEVASGQALEDQIALSPSTLLQADEAETFMAPMERKGRNNEALSNRFRRLATASSGVYALRMKAGQEPKVVVNPHLSFFGTGTPEAFFNSLSSHTIVNGSFGRCLVVKAEDAYTMQQPTEEPVPEEILAAAKYLADLELKIAETGNLTPVVVPETPEASMLMRSMNDTIMTMRKRYGESDLEYARAIMVRVPEKIAKCALLYAISKDYKNPIIDAAAVHWAESFVMQVTNSMLYESQYHVSEGAFDHLQKRTLGIIAHKGGTASQRDLMRALHVDVNLFKRIILSLIVCDDIVEDTEFGKSPLYSLKNAA